MRVRGLKPVNWEKFASLCVAPHAGAWIETCGVRGRLNTTLSHPMRVRGLKLSVVTLSLRSMVSHPMRVRGLKHHLFTTPLFLLCRTPCGCVD